MEELLCDAAMKGDRVLLQQIIAADEYILDKVLVGSFKGKNPLHVAISTGKEEFVGELLQIKPSLAEILDAEVGAALHIASAKGNLEIVKALVVVKPEMCLARDRDDNNPLHIASARGDLGIVKALVMVSPQMCLARDRDGNNPLHIAAMKGKVDVLEELIRTGSQRTKVKVDPGDTILHLCVKYDQFQCLKLLLDKIPDPDFLNDIDADGNNILHLAFFDKRWKMIKYVLDKNNCKIDVNATNKSRRTALDIHLLDVGNPADSVHKEIKDILLHAGAKPGKLVAAEHSWEIEDRKSFMIVATLIGTIAFQAGVNPPGGVWQDDSAGHQAGKAILAYKYPILYPGVVFVNTFGLLASLSLLFFFVTSIQGPTRVRLARAGLCCLTLMPTAIVYTCSIIATWPDDNAQMRSTISGIKAITIWWALIGTLFQLNLATPLFPLKWKMRLKCCGGWRPRSPPNAVGGREPVQQP